MEDIVIRLIDKGDRDLIEGFFKQMAPDSRAFFNRNDGNHRWALSYFSGNDRPHMRRWVAVRGGEMVGYVFLWDTDTSIPWLGIAVAECLRGRHFGQTLLETAADWCRAEGKGGILLTTHMANVRAQALYERSGYERMGVATNGEVLYLKRL